MGIRAVISGLGFVTSIGNHKTAVIENLRNLQHGIEPFAFLDNPDLPIKVAGTIKEFETDSPHCADWRYPDAYHIDRQILRSLPPHGLYAHCAMQQALADSRLQPDDISDGRSGLYCASAGSPFLLRHYLNQMHANRGLRGNPMGVVSSIAGTLNFNLGTHFKIRGVNCGFVSACTSSSHALGYAFDDILLGRQQRALVVGAEELNAEAVLPFIGMRALSRNADPDRASRPFDRRRDGFVGTGGAVVLILENAAVAQARCAPIYAEMVNWGQASDGHNLAISHPEGRGLKMAIQNALCAARIQPRAVDFVNAHATSTQTGDRAEALALQAVFSAAGVYPHVSSTKALTGHGLSMAGVMEAAFSALALETGMVIGAAHLEDLDPACDGLSLPRHSRMSAPEVAVSNSSGFGGSNVCLVFRRWRP